MTPELNALHVVMKTVRLDCRAFEEGGRFVARCDALRISDHGSTEEQAFENLVETVRLFFESCIRRGMIEQVLLERGVSVQGAHSNGVAREDQDAVVIPMPWMVLSSRHDRNRAH